jgi:hypothetical protein
VNLNWLSALVIFSNDLEHTDLGVLFDILDVHHVDISLAIKEKEELTIESSKY